MLYETGIAISEEGKHDIVVAAVTWHCAIRPNFPTHHITLRYAQEHLAACVVVYNADIRTTVNAACQRTVEQLLIQTNFKVAQPPRIQLIVSPRFAAKKQFVLPHIKKRYHWLLSAADSTLLDWLRGVR